MGLLLPLNNCIEKQWVSKRCGNEVFVGPKVRYSLQQGITLGGVV